MKIQKYKALCYKYSEIEMGLVHSFEKKITQLDVLNFADITGDFNPLHINQDYGKKSQFGKNIVHGMLVGSLFSTLIGMYCPGEKSLYLSQTLNFKHPLFYGDKVLVRGTVINKNDCIKIITLRTEILKDRIVVINGEAKVKVLED